MISQATMKDPHSVLRQKEQDLERVHKEIQALRTVIPLLADDQPSSDVMDELLLAVSRAPVDPSNNGMPELELYYPFVTHLRTE
jgi:hypothetical protein